MYRCFSAMPPGLNGTVGLVAAILALPLLNGCGASRHEVSSNVRHLPGMSIRYYGDAHASFFKSMTMQAGPAERRAQLEHCVKLLRAAISTSSNDAGDKDAYVCPLFRTTLGEILMEGDDAAKLEAFELFERSVWGESGAAEWIPGWIGKATWATDAVATSADNAERAEFYLTKAEEGLEQLIGAGMARPELRPLRGILSFTQPSQDDEPPRDDASLGADRRRRMIWNWLLASQQWWDPTWAAPTAASEPRPAADSMRSLERRLRARIALQRSRIRLAQGQPPSVVRSTLRAYRVDDKLGGALDWDPDYWPALLLEARMYRLEGNLDAAEKPVRSLLTLQGSILAGNPRLALELGLIYADWYARDKKWDYSKAALDQLRMVTKTLDPYSAEAWLAIARVQVVATVHEDGLSKQQRRAILGDARGAVDLAERSGANPRAVDELRKRIETAVTRVSQE